ncbi:hypothetical protein CAOG_06768 [Capsaspora owczarzaki ATCC 30864]|uniref:Uncharacterized protein n=1 Tax=Capsaspora owczarzaki (strain ATCC 30864) TaxID=595528 RepID=A0A0D2WVU7_CAPO3|nr:hypothetical protein CAOG_06768 [Capsaspora owczarzaki ATCC 30864]KJE96443.1 hypothetical protein CAOG_006768 [Capsaspora owczarzaki ATCC 30864]|eukprot:XP_004344389.2 hypothetical protein CAOG_06768 [Capsaspora owczarzaki ATCC 30864]
MARPGRGRPTHPPSNRGNGTTPNATSTATTSQAQAQIPSAEAIAAAAGVYRAGLLASIDATVVADAGDETHSTDDDDDGDDDDDDYEDEDEGRPVINYGYDDEEDYETDEDDEDEDDDDDHHHHHDYDDDEDYETDEDDDDEDYETDDEDDNTSVRRPVNTQERTTQQFLAQVQRLFQDHPPITDEEDQHVHNEADVTHWRMLAMVLGVGPLSAHGTDATMLVAAKAIVGSLLYPCDASRVGPPGLRLQSRIHVDHSHHGHHDDPLDPAGTVIDDDDDMDEMSDAGDDRDNDGSDGMSDADDHDDHDDHDHDHDHDDDHDHPSATRIPSAWASLEYESSAIHAPHHEFPTTLSAHELSDFDTFPRLTDYHMDAQELETDIFLPQLALQPPSYQALQYDSTRLEVRDVHGVRVEWKDEAYESLVRPTSLEARPILARRVLFDPSEADPAAIPALDRENTTVLSMAHRDALELRPFEPRYSYMNALCRDTRGSILQPLFRLITERATPLAITSFLKKWHSRALPTQVELKMARDRFLQRSDRHVAFAESSAAVEGPQLAGPVAVVPIPLPEYNLESDLCVELPYALAGNVLASRLAAVFTTGARYLEPSACLNFASPFGVPISVANPNYVISPMQWAAAVGTGAIIEALADFGCEIEPEVNAVVASLSPDDQYFPFFAGGHSSAFAPLPTTSAQLPTNYAFHRLSDRASRSIFADLSTADGARAMVPSLLPASPLAIAIATHNASATRALLARGASLSSLPLFAVPSSLPNTNLAHSVAGLLENSGAAAVVMRHLDSRGCPIPSLSNAVDFASNSYTTLEYVYQARKFTLPPGLPPNARGLTFLASKAVARLLVDPEYSLRNVPPSSTTRAQYHRHLRTRIFHQHFDEHLQYALATVPDLQWNLLAFGVPSTEWKSPLETLSLLARVVGSPRDLWGSLSYDKPFVVPTGAEALSSASNKAQIAFPNESAPDAVSDPLTRPSLQLDFGRLKVSTEKKSALIAHRDPLDLRDREGSLALRQTAARLARVASFIEAYDDATIDALFDALRKKNYHILALEELLLPLAASSLTTRPPRFIIAAEFQSMEDVFLLMSAVTGFMCSYLARTSQAGITILRATRFTPARLVQRSDHSERADKRSAHAIFERCNRRFMDAIIYSIDIIDALSASIAFSGKAGVLATELSGALAEWDQTVDMFLQQAEEDTRPPCLAKTLLAGSSIGEYRNHLLRVVSLLRRLNDDEMLPDFCHVPADIRSPFPRRNLIKALTATLERASMYGGLPEDRTVLVQDYVRLVAHGTPVPSNADINRVVSSVSVGTSRSSQRGSTTTTDDAAEVVDPAMQASYFQAFMSGGPLTTPLTMAAVNNDYDAVAAILQSSLPGGQRLRSTSKLLTPLHLTSSPRVARLLATQFYINTRTPFCNVSACQDDVWNIEDLMQSSRSGHTPSAAIVKVPGQPPFDAASCLYGSTPLHIACAFGHLDLVRTLVDLGADLHILDAWRRTPLDVAKHRHHEEVSAFIESALGLTPSASSNDHQDSLEDQLLQYVTTSGDLPCVDNLLAQLLALTADCPDRLAQLLARKILLTQVRGAAVQQRIQRWLRDATPQLGYALLAVAFASLCAPLAEFVLQHLPPSAERPVPALLWLLQSVCRAPAAAQCSMLPLFRTLLATSTLETEHLGLLYLACNGSFFEAVIELQPSSFERDDFESRKFYFAYCLHAWELVGISMLLDSPSTSAAKHAFSCLQRQAPSRAVFRDKLFRMAVLTVCCPAMQFVIDMYREDDALSSIAGDFIKHTVETAQHRDQFFKVAKGVDFLTKPMSYGSAELPDRFVPTLDWSALYDLVKAYGVDLQHKCAILPELLPPELRADPRTGTPFRWTALTLALVLKDDLASVASLHAAGAPVVDNAPAAAPAADGSSISFSIPVPLGRLCESSTLRSALLPDPAHPANHHPQLLTDVLAAYAALPGDEHYADSIDLNNFFNLFNDTIITWSDANTFTIACSIFAKVVSTLQTPLTREAFPFLTQLFPLVSRITSNVAVKLPADFLLLNEDWCIHNEHPSAPLQLYKLRELLKLFRVLGASAADMAQASLITGEQLLGQLYQVYRPLSYLWALLDWGVPISAAAILSPLTIRLLLLTDESVDGVDLHPLNHAVERNEPLTDGCQYRIVQHFLQVLRLENQLATWSQLAWQWLEPAVRCRAAPAIIPMILDAIPIIYRERLAARPPPTILDSLVFCEQGPEVFRILVQFAPSLKGLVFASLTRALHQPTVVTPSRLSHLSRTELTDLFVEMLTTARGARQILSDDEQASEPLLTTSLLRGLPKVAKAVMAFRHVNRSELHMPNAHVLMDAVLQRLAVAMRVCHLSSADDSASVNLVSEQFGVQFLFEIQEIVSLLGHRQGPVAIGADSTTQRRAMDSNGYSSLIQRVVAELHPTNQRIAMDLEWDRGIEAINLIFDELPLLGPSFMKDLCWVQHPVEAMLQMAFVRSDFIQVMLTRYLCLEPNHRTISGHDLGYMLEALPPAGPVVGCFAMVLIDLQSCIRFEHRASDYECMTCISVTSWADVVARMLAVTLCVASLQAEDLDLDPGFYDEPDHVASNTLAIRQLCQAVAVSRADLLRACQRFGEAVHFAPFLKSI